MNHFEKLKNLCDTPSRENFHAILRFFLEIRVGNISEKEEMLLLSYAKTAFSAWCYEHALIYSHNFSQNPDIVIRSLTKSIKLNHAPPNMHSHLNLSSWNSLKQLYATLSHCEKITLPTQLEEMSLEKGDKLKEINFSHTNLKILHLNEMRPFPYLIPNLKLEEMRIDDCALSFFNVKIPSLQNIYIEHCPLSRIDLSQCPNLTNIVIRHNPNLKKITVPDFGILTIRDNHPDVILKRT